MRNRSLYSIFTAWHDNHVREVVLPGKIKKALNRFFMQDKSYAIGVLKDFVLSKLIFAGERPKAGGFEPKKILFDDS